MRSMKWSVEVHISVQSGVTPPVPRSLPISAVHGLAIPADQAARGLRSEGDGGQLDDNVRHKVGAAAAFSDRRAALPEAKAHGQ